MLTSHAFRHVASQDNDRNPRHESPTHCLSSAMKQMLTLSFLALFPLALPYELAGAQTEQEIALAKQIQPLIDAHKGRVGVAIKHLPSGASFRYQADVPMPTASLIKFPIMISAFKKIEAGDLRADQMITLQEEDKVPGSGILTSHFSKGTQISLRDAIQLMIAFSDNTATNLVIDQIGLGTVAKDMAELGCPETQVHAKVYRGDTSIAPERSAKYGLGSTTADDMVKLYELLSQKKLMSESASESMLTHLRSCEDRTKIGKFIPSGVKVAHKTGEVTASRTDAGIIEAPDGPILIAVLTTDNEDQRWADDNSAHLLCAEIGRIAYTTFQKSDLADTAAAGPLKSGSNGLLVEALQRTLNSRLVPSPQLAVDGDFGGMTEAAVKQFQKEHNLSITGTVDEATWRALGTLVTEDDPVPDPEKVNKDRGSKAPRDELDGPPFVTAKGWAILDAESGALLWGMNENQRLDNASTTKVMTALVVCRFAEKDPLLWDLPVTFSSQADAVEGSTAAIRAGETLPISELMYGLLLPSGNDAAHALAETLGATIGGESSNGNTLTAYQAFIAEMNRAAQEMGLSSSAFRNPHGLTEEGHGMSARDLARLGWEAMKFEPIRKCVGTSKRGFRIQGAEGYTRNLLWENTNQLLATQGYDGIKTGTTDAAGACLLSRGWRDGRGLIVAVLGSQSSAARYTDSRNLYRWAWNEIKELKEPAREAERGEIKVSAEAMRIHQSALLVDGHNDLPWNIRERSSRSFDKLNIENPQPSLHTDIPRLHAGGVDAQFWSVWVPASTAYDGTALQTTLEQMDIVKGMLERYPATFELALTSGDIRRIVASGKIASMIGVEGGHSIENSLGVLHQLFKRGARYMTLTHSDSLDWADSATDFARHGGLSTFGEEVIREMNLLGMMVDISHVSPECMQDVLSITKAPVIFSHSSARAVADHPRNVPDEILRQIPANGGVVMVNFYSGFVVPEAARLGQRYLELKMELKKKYPNEPEKIQGELQRFDSTHPSPAGTIHDVLDHIDHIVKVAGVDSVGIGSDFDGIPTVPKQLEDVSCYPKITQGLLDRGYMAVDIEKILGGNLLRVMTRVEEVAADLKGNRP
jgi:serine-type D-Ala-D-Ala carboxypeptidase (penicillin-binding protein 5/6)